MMIRHPSWCDLRLCAAATGGPHRSLERHVFAVTHEGRAARISVQLRRPNDGETTIELLTVIEGGERSYSSIGMSLTRAAALNGFLTSMLIRAES